MIASLAISPLSTVASTAAAAAAATPVNSSAANIAFNTAFNAAIIIHSQSVLSQNTSSASICCQSSSISAGSKVNVTRLLSGSSKLENSCCSSRSCGSSHRSSSCRINSSLSIQVKKSSNSEDAISSVKTTAAAAAPSATLDSDLQQSSLLQTIHEILLSSPHVGVYRNESSSHWSSFQSSMLSYFSSREGPRARVSEEISSLLLPHAAELSVLFSDLLGLEFSSTSIKEINNKCENWMSSNPIIREIEAAVQAHQRSEQTLSELQISGTKVRHTILAGLLKSKKYTTDQQINERLSLILTQRASETAQLARKVENLQEKLHANPIYSRFLHMMSLLSESLDRWNSLDKQVGKDTMLNGKKLEDLVSSVSSTAMQVIFRRLARNQSDITIHRNVRWEGIDGEVDVILTDAAATTVLAVVEVKSRVFDIAAAFRQSGPERHQDKQRVIIGTRLIDVPRDAPFFVVTAIPEQKTSFTLAFESKLKDSLSRFFSQTEPQFVDYTEVYRVIKPIFGGYYSPLDWFEQFSQKHLVVFGEEERLVGGGVVGGVVGGGVVGKVVEQRIIEGGEEDDEEVEYRRDTDDDDYDYFYDPRDQDSPRSTASGESLRLLSSQNSSQVTASEFADEEDDEEFFGILSANSSAFKQFKMVSLLDHTTVPPNLLLPPHPHRLSSPSLSQKRVMRSGACSTSQSERKQWQERKQQQQQQQQQQQEYKCEELLLLGELALLELKQQESSEHKHEMEEEEEQNEEERQRQLQTQTKKEEKRSGRKTKRGGRRTTLHSLRTGGLLASSPFNNSGNEDVCENSSSLQVNPVGKIARKHRIAKQISTAIRFGALFEQSKSAISQMNEMIIPNQMMIPNSMMIHQN